MELLSFRLKCGARGVGVCYQRFAMAAFSGVDLAAKLRRLLPDNTV
tara:strand:- start:624 stop:761 length:138 start_codon:yes stop_codon:yes gene_type:complete